MRLFHTCRLSCTRSASLLASAASKILACSRNVLWDFPRPESFPFSCSNSSTSFLLASSRRRILFLKLRDSCSCGKEKWEKSQSVFVQDTSCIEPQLKILMGMSFNWPRPLVPWPSPDILPARCWWGWWPLGALSQAWLYSGLLPSALSAGTPLWPEAFTTNTQKKCPVVYSWHHFNIVAVMIVV